MKTLKLSTNAFVHGRQVFSAMLKNSRNAQISSLKLEPLISGILGTVCVGLPLPPIGTLAMNVRGLVNCSVCDPGSSFTSSLLTRSKLGFLTPRRSFINTPVRVILFTVKVK